MNIELPNNQFVHEHYQLQAFCVDTPVALGLLFVNLWAT
jgi:hypothetical protein